MVKPHRPKFSARTKLVFAKLDRKLPFDEKAIDEMVAKRAIVRVRDNVFLRQRFKAAGHKPRFYEHVYAIPFRHLLDKSRDIHHRSLHTLDAGGRQFVFKGTGSVGPTSFQRERREVDQDRALWGGARRESVKHAVETLGKLERVYKQAKAHRDALVEWAEKEHGITELPVIKHAAVFRPLQMLDIILQSWSQGKYRAKTIREQVTSKAMDALALKEFTGQLRVHAYTAKEPSRIPEAGYKQIEEQLAATRSSPSIKNEPDVRRAALKQFIARGLLLMHIARLGKTILTLPDQKGSVFFPHNASWREFFDFDTARRITNLRLGDYELREWDEITNLSHSIQDMAHQLGKTGINNSGQIRLGIKNALGAARDQQLNRRARIETIDQAVEEITKAAFLR